MTPPTAEHLRLTDPAWRTWGPYLADRQWGAVREDYSKGGTAWDYFPFEHAHSRAYRWGEDGIAGVSDDRQRLCLAVALWNGRDPVLKERLFGLTNEQGNHGEDVKEAYYHLDATPTHSYLKLLYKYPQAEFPYRRLVEENRRRGRLAPEFELADTGVFDGDRYFDVVVEYAKAAPTDLLMRVTAHNRGPDAADLHVLPHLWFRNVWSWVADALPPTVAADGPAAVIAVPADGEPTWYATFDGAPELLFCENETNARRLFNSPAAAYPKDGINDCVVSGDRRGVSPDRTGSKCAGHYRFTVPAGGSVTVRVRLSQSPPTIVGGLSETPTPFDDLFTQRIQEADEFYAHIQHGLADPDARLIQRQAFAGLLWTKQFYSFDVRTWLTGDPAQPAPPAERWAGRDSDWQHLEAGDILSMPDKWEYPWFAAWDSAFHTLPFAVLDPEFAKSQLLVFLEDRYQHPNGQLPAYEWNFTDTNPPVHAWATWRVFQIDRARRHDLGDVAFLERAFHKLLLNFTWWVNRKDANGRNIFQGGFLGLDNIGVFDRSQPLPVPGYVNQSDATAWMAMYALNLMRIALELALHNPVYQDLASKFFDHFLQIALAMTDFGQAGGGLWDEADGFYYDQLATPDGKPVTLRVRSIVGLIPLFAVETLEPKLLARVPEFAGRVERTLARRPDLAGLVSRWNEPGAGERRLLSLLRGSRMKKLLKRMLDPAEFLSPHGVRALSKAHQANPFRLPVNGDTLTVAYLPGESDTGAFGGNSNWRGPVWFPVNYLIVESLQKFHHYYGPEFKVEHPTGSGQMRTLEEIAADLGDRLTRLFLRGPDGRRPVFGDDARSQTDPHFRDCVPFYEYFHGDTGRGLGASHQTGWTALVAKLLMPRRPDPIDRYDCPESVKRHRG